MKEKIITNTLPGFTELLPAEQIAFNKMLDIIRKAYEVFGFTPIDTPVLERANVLLAKAGGETEKQIYRFKKGQTDLAMRFDLTVPLARYVSEHYNNLVFPFKRYSLGKVYRGERPQAGRFREFYQCDIDVIGNEELNLRFDAEIPVIIYTIFKELGFEKFTISINNRKIFNGLFESLNIQEQSAQVMQSIDKLEKIGEEEVRKELEKLSLPPESIKKIFKLLGLKGSCNDVIDGLKKLEIKNEQFEKGTEEISEVTKYIKQFGVPENNFKINLTIARGLDYYTGTVYETKLDEYPEIGSVCSGGRYDDLVSEYISRKLPGVGISIGLTRLFDQLYKRGLIQIKSSTLTKVLILPMSEDTGYGLKLATKLRENNVPVEISFAQNNIKKRLGYANKLGIPYVIFIGEDEVRDNTFFVKDMISGEQIKINIEDISRAIKILNK
ncbi:MAG: histidine--tRNA ligase [Candidatus Pacebacteria bacterium]|nr:histidine--tRNA ligase [Candidatus Paceibacterota bacterium]